MAPVQDTLAGRYELHEVLGRGGMGVVHRATDQVLGRPVAIKLLPAEHAADRAFVARFEREALAAASLSHPNIVAVYDSGHDGRTRFIVMECVRGQDLRRLLRTRGRVPADRAVAIAAQIASALSAAHRAGIVHRDIKPANVMLNDAGHVKVLDFGIARAADSTALTRTSAVIGSASYLAPELARGARADARSDIYALGCVLYELLAGRPPFTGEVPAAILHQHATASPPPPADAGVRVPPGLEALVMAMLAKDPDRRPQRADELAALLSAPPDPTAPTRVRPGRRRRGHSPLELAGLSLAALLVIIGIALAALSSGSPHRAAGTHRSQAARHSGPKAPSAPARTPAVTGPAPAAAPAHAAPGPHAPGHGPKPDHGPKPGRAPGQGGHPGHGHGRHG